MTIDQLEELQVGTEQTTTPEPTNRHGFALTLTALVVLFFGLVYALFNLNFLDSKDGRISVGTARQPIERTSEWGSPSSRSAPSHSNTAAPAPSAETASVPATTKPAPVVQPKPSTPTATATMIPIPPNPPAPDGQVTLSSQCSYHPPTGTESIVVNVDNPAKVTFQVIVHIGDQAWPSSITNSRNVVVRREAHPYPSPPACWAEAVRR